MYVQIDSLSHLILDINHLQVPELEADDVIASYTKEARSRGHEVVIVTDDKDYIQLMQDGVRIYNPAKKTYLSEEDVREKNHFYISTRSYGLLQP